MNDLLFLHIHKGAGGNEPVAWQKLTPLITQMESLVSEAGYAVVSGYLKRPVSGEPGKPHKPAQLLLAGPPRTGSIVLPFALELPATLNIVGQVPMPGAGPSALSDYIGALADLVTLAHFVRDLLFGSRGLIARRTDQLSGEPEGNREARALEEAVGMLSHLTPSVEKLLQAAEATGCKQLEMQVNDQTKIQLIMASRRRRSSLIARQAVPVSGMEMPAGYFFDPSRTNEMVRNSQSQIAVEFDGRQLNAFVLHVHSPSGQSVVVVWDAQMPMPKVGATVEVVGRPIERDDLQPLEDVPLEFEAATAIFLVDRARPSWA